MPITLAQAASDVEVLRTRLLAQAQALADYLDRWHAMAGQRAPAA